MINVSHRSRMSSPVAERRLLVRHLDLGLVAAISLATLAGLIVRLAPVIFSGFPVNDGGLFYSMIHDLQLSHYRLPEVTSYNGGQIPFAYPPLTFYLVAFLSDITHTGVLLWLRFLPPLVSAATVPIFFPLARRLSPSRTVAGFAIVAFALLPNSFDWAIAGGGLPRSVGFVFAILALHQVHRAYVDRVPGAWFFMGLFSGLCLLSHPLVAAFLACSVGVFFVAFGHSRSSLAVTLAAAAVAFALSAPWWVTVLIHSGPEPLLSAAQTGGNSFDVWLVNLVAFKFGGEPFFPLLSALALLGLLWSLAARRWLLPMWLGVMFFTTPRLAFHSSSLPLAILAGIGIVEVVMPLARGAARSDEARRSPWWSDGRTRTVAYVIFMFAGFSATLASAAQNSNLRTLTPEARSAAAWIQLNTAPEARIAVVTHDVSWGRDQLSEWFPALTDRESVVTVQGYEWMGVERALRQQDAYQALQACGDKSESCLSDWTEHYGILPDYFAVAVAPYTALVPAVDVVDRCATLRLSLEHSSFYQTVFVNEGVEVFRRVVS